MKRNISEKDLEQIFIASRFKRRNPWIVFLKFFTLFILFFAIIFISLNFSAFKQKIIYFYQDEFSSENSNALSSIISSSDIQTEDAQNKIPNISDNSIYIESINVKAPITFRVSNDETAVVENLKNGVIHLESTSLPGNVGNVFITGHSSNYPWVKSSYNSIFALLNKVVIGDAVLIKFQNQNYIYRVKDIFITSSSNISVLNSDDNQSILTLMTCSPVGTNLKRLIIVADQVIPNPSYNSTVNTGYQTKNLPEGVQ